MNALDVAHYFLLKSDDDAGDVISKLKLQKLLYYAQGFHLALVGKPLFADKIYAWEHGPVVLNVYHHYKAHDKVLPTPKSAPRIDQKTKGILDEIYGVYGQFSAWKLRNMTHAEPPWKDKEQSKVITHKALLEYFKTQVV